MKKSLLALLLFMTTLTNAQTIKTVGPGQQYLTINQAYASIPGTISGPYEIHLMAGYSSFSETFPIVFDARNGSSSTNTITIIPQFSGATISTAAASTIEFDGCSYVAIDGSISATGDTANLKILNTSTTYRPIVLKNGASNNLISFCDMMAPYGGSNAGVVDLRSGSNNNTFISNVLHSLASNVPNILVYSEANCNGTRLDGNYFYDCSTYAVRITGSSSNVVVDNNHIYQGTYGFPNFLWMDEGTASINNNYFGGSGAFCSGLATTGKRFVLHQGQLSSSVTSNTIQNFNIVDATTLTFIDCPTCQVDNNLLGSIDGDTAVIVQVGQSNVNITGIIAKDASGNSISGIAGLKKTGVTSGFGTFSFGALKVRAEAQNNIVGSTTVPNSISVQFGLQGFVSGISQAPLNTNPTGVNNVVSNITIHGHGGTTSSGTGFTGISLNQVTDCTVQNIDSYGRSHIMVYGVPTGVFDCTVQDIHVRAGELTGIKSGGNTWNNTVNNLTNTLESPSTSGIERPIVGIELDGVNTYGVSTDNTISNLSCSASNTSFKTIGIYSEDFMDKEISHNIIQNVQSADAAYGIYITDDFAHFIGNGNYPDTVWIKNNVIDTLVSLDFSATGVYLDYEDGVSTIPLIVADNQISSVQTKGSASGISVVTLPNAELNEIRANILEGLYAENGSVLGIYYYPQGPCLIEANTVQDLRITNSTSSNNRSIRGIQFSSSLLSYSEHSAKNNLIHALFNEGTDIAEIRGITGGFDNYNNIIRLGLDETGAGVSSNDIIIGMETRAGNVFNNTIYITGESESGTSDSYCYKLGQSFTSIQLINNILVNDRSNSLSGAGLHLNYISSTILNQTLNFNLHDFSGSGAAIASFDGGTTLVSDQTSLQNAIPGQNLNSLVGDPLFIAPNQDLTGQNMSPGNGSSAFGNGVYLPAVTEDFFYATRSFTPTIGAIENSFYVGVPENEEKGMLFYPNPTKDFLNVESTNSRIKGVALYNSVGALVLTEIGTPIQNKRIDLSGLSNGVYLLMVETENEVSRTKVLIE